MITAEEMRNEIVSPEVRHDIELIEEELRKAISLGFVMTTFHGRGFKDQTIKYLLDKGYHYIEHDGVFGDFDVTISCKPYYVGPFDREITYDDLRL